ncbi:MAG: 2-iminoacetate synthase ThiH [Spirochaetota bacterium]
MFTELFHTIEFSQGVEQVLAQRQVGVSVALQRAIQGIGLRFQDYLALVSPAAAPFLEEMAALSRNITLQRFGKTIQLFTPLYLSNECRSSCTYCGFSFENKIPRKTLSLQELEKEAQFLAAKGLKHILLLTGEDYSKTPVSYIAEAVALLQRYFPAISIEIYPLSLEKYQELLAAGVEGLVLYQETYDKDTYAKYHLRGMKKDMEYRLLGPDRGGIAGFRRLGLGALLGLSAPEGEMYFLGMHIQYLYKKYWKTQLQASLPRMRPAEGDFSGILPVDDRKFLQFLFALRITFPDLGLVLSTRETPSLRNNLLGLGITTMSAGSKTDPGGHTNSGELKQFEIEDTRSFEETVEVIRQKGYDPVCKDFDLALAKK